MTGKYAERVVEHVALAEIRGWQEVEIEPGLARQCGRQWMIQMHRDAKALAASWRASGGSLRIQDFQLLWGPLDFSASGTLALDENLQPEGEGNAHAVGYAETLDALATHAAISRSAATAAKAVLSLLASYPADGGAPSVDVPLTLKDRTLAMHQVPLLRLPQIDLP